MVRCIPTFVILGLIASLTINHPISIDNVDEIVETAGIQSVDDVFATTIPFDSNDAAETTDAVYDVEDLGGEAVPTTAPFIVEEVSDTVEVQAVDIEEPTEVDENSTAGVQAIEEDVEEDIVAGVQGVEDVEEDDIAVAEVTPTSTADEVVAQAADDESNEMEFELFEEGEEADDEMTAAGVINEEINAVQDSAPVPSAEDAAAYKNLALEALNRLKILHIFRTGNDSKPNKYLRGKMSLRDDEALDSQLVEDISQTIFEIAEATEVPVTEVETASPEEVTDAPVDIFEIQQQKRWEDSDVVEATEAPVTEIETSSPEEVTEAPTDIFEAQKQKRWGWEDDDVHVALFDIEVETAKNDFETVTEVVTDVHVVSAVIDDDDQPTIGAIAIDPIEDNQDVEEEIPLFGVIEEIDDEEVQIAKKDEIFVEISYEIVEVSSEQQTPVEETTESLVISGILIDLTEQEQQSEAATTEAVTDVVEEPTIIN